MNPEYRNARYILHYGKRTKIRTLDDDSLKMHYNETKRSYGNKVVGIHLKDEMDYRGISHNAEINNYEIY